MKRIFKIRLYRIQEYDLYTLYFDPVFDLRSAMTQAVTAYAEGRPAPRFDASHVLPLEQGKPISIVMSITLRSENAIRVMEAASQHGRNAGNLAKFLVRKCLTGMEHIYFDSTEATQPETGSVSGLDTPFVPYTGKVSKTGKLGRTKPSMEEQGSIISSRESQSPLPTSKIKQQMSAHASGKLPINPNEAGKQEVNAKPYPAPGRDQTTSQSQTAGYGGSQRIPDDEPVESVTSALKQDDTMEDTMPANSGGIFDFVSNLMDGF